MRQENRVTSLAQTTIRWSNPTPSRLSLQHYAPTITLKPAYLFRDLRIDDADVIRSALFKDASRRMRNWNGPCAQLNCITDYEGKEPRDLLIEGADMFYWQDANLGQTNIVEHTIATSEATSIRQSQNRMPPSLLEEANSLVEQTIGSELIKPSKSPRTSLITLAMK
ncbi:hypothetical protein TSMEX_006186 [Taenia solium]|eukprot:TsM_001228400 transcript=TsM_001228400 gene=TsM_001228400